MNNVALMGRLTRDPYISRKGTPVARFTLACDRRVDPEVAKQKGMETADFVPCVAFDHNVDFVERYMKTGGKFAIIGSVKTGRYDTANGQTVYTVEILAKTIEFAGGSKSEQPANADRKDEDDVKTETDTNSSSDFLDIDDDDEPVE